MDSYTNVGMRARVYVCMCVSVAPLFPRATFKPSLYCADTFYRLIFLLS